MELWADIPGFDGEYQLSSEGKIRSCRRSGNPGNRRKKLSFWRERLPSNSGKGYSLITLRDAKTRKLISFLVHRLVYELFAGPIPENQEIDHINRVKKDNRIDNLRLVTKSQQHYNIGKFKKKGNSSKYKGVHFCNSVHKWLARITIDKKIRTIGSFSTELEAAIAYDSAAKIAFKEYACLNFSENIKSEEIH